jgi:hypothetical protein
MRKFVCAAVVAVCAVSVAMSDEYFAVIKKIDGDKVTIIKGKKKGTAGEELTLTLAKDAKINKGKFDADTKKLVAGDAIEGGTKGLSEMVEKAGEKGVAAMIITDADNKNITEIRVGKKGKKKAAN